MDASYQLFGSTVQLADSQKVVVLKPSSGSGFGMLRDQCREIMNGNLEYVLIGDQMQQEDPTPGAAEASNGGWGNYLGRKPDVQNPSIDIIGAAVSYRNSLQLLDLSATNRDAKETLVYLARASDMQDPFPVPVNTLARDRNGHALYESVFENARGQVDGFSLVTVVRYGKLERIKNIPNQHVAIFGMTPDLRDRLGFVSR